MLKVVHFVKQLFFYFLYNYIINLAFRIYEKVFVRIIWKDSNNREKGGRPQAESGRKVRG